MTALTAVLLYAAFTLVLAVFYAFPRVPRLLFMGMSSDSWERDKPNVDPPILVRAKHAHHNAVENFAVFAAVVVVGMLMQKAPVVDALGAWVLAARVGQSLAHIAGTALPFVALRATLFLAQVGMVLAMVWGLLH